MAGLHDEEQVFVAVNHGFEVFQQSAMGQIVVFSKDVEKHDEVEGQKGEMFFGAFMGLRSVAKH